MSKISTKKPLNEEENIKVDTDEFGYNSNPNTNGIKKEFILKTFYEESFEPEDLEKIMTLNLSRNSQLDNLKVGDLALFKETLLAKKTALISDTKINLTEQEEGIVVAFYCSTNYYYSGNTQLGVEKNLTISRTIDALNTVNNPNLRQIMCFGGNLFSKKFKIGDLSKAKIKDNSEKSKPDQLEFYPITLQKAMLKSDIYAALRAGKEVYLMGGYQEHEANQYFNTNYLEQVYYEFTARNNITLEFYRNLYNEVRKAKNKNKKIKVNVVNDFNPDTFRKMFNSLSKDTKLKNALIKKSYKNVSEIILDYNFYRNLLKKIKKELCSKNKITLAEIEDTMNFVKNPKIHYINEGVNVLLKVVKKNSDGTYSYNNINMQTNINTKAKSITSNLRAAEEWNGPILPGSDVVFSMNANVAAEALPNVFLIPGEKRYLNTARNKKPLDSPVEYCKYFTIFVEGSHDMSVIPNIFNIDENKADNEMYVYNKKCELEAKRDIAIEKINHLTESVEDALIKGDLYEN